VGRSARVYGVIRGDICRWLEAFELTPATRTHGGKTRGKPPCSRFPAPSLREAAPWRSPVAVRWRLHRRRRAATSNGRQRQRVATTSACDGADQSASRAVIRRSASRLVASQEPSGTNGRHSRGPRPAGTSRQPRERIGHPNRHWQLSDVFRRRGSIHRALRATAALPLARGRECRRWRPRAGRLPPRFAPRRASRIGSRGSGVALPHSPQLGDRPPPRAGANAQHRVNRARHQLGPPAKT